MSDQLLRCYLRSDGIERHRSAVVSDDQRHLNGINRPGQIGGCAVAENEAQRARRLDRRLHGHANDGASEGKRPVRLLLKGIWRSLPCVLLKVKLD